MTILSSDINMQAHSSQSYEHKSKEKINIEFSLNLIKQEELIQNQQSQEDEGEILKTKEELKNRNISVIIKNLIHDEKDLPPKDFINKYIAQRLTSLFSGNTDKTNEFYPRVDTQDSITNMIPRRNLFSLQSTTKTTIETTHEYHKENEINFKAQGVIQTADKEINIDLNLSFSQAFHEKHKEKLEYSKTVLMDPLIIKYDLSSNYFDSISEELTFKFDLDSSGEEVDIPLLKEGSGFLALDKNKNGSVDDGNELFGPNTNNGFEELRQYDEDGNGWIDEADSIYNDLTVWSKNEKGDDTLIALSTANVGAIYLSDIQSSFNYDKSVNEGMAYLKQSSIFLTNEGKTGLVTGVDFAVS